MFKGGFLRVFLILLLFVSAGLLSCQRQVSSGGSESVAPDFTLNDLEGRPFRFADTRGKVVILDFWATWCPPCKRELPHFQELYEEYKDEGLVVIGIALDREGASAVKPFVEAHGFTYPVLIGDKRITATYGGIRGIPTTFVIDRQGRIVEKYVGYRDKQVFESVIRKLL